MIKNFGAIKDAEIEIRNILILIGEQASGKSTIAKLIYFFKSIGDDFFRQVYNIEQEKYNETTDLKKPIRKKFYDFFGSTYHLPNFEITYYYNFENLRFLTLSLGTDKRLIATFSKGFFTTNLKNSINNNKKNIIDIENKLKSISDKREQIVLESNKDKAAKYISDTINSLFENTHTSSLFMVAGRETTVSYEATFEAHLEKSIEKAIEENRKSTFKAKEQTVDENLMIDFLQETRRIKSVFKKYGNSFESVVSNLAPNDLQLAVLLKNINLILKGKYIIDKFGEMLLLDTNQRVYLKNASSGQKEVIRILQDAILCMIERQNAFRVIEEPEAHLFPVAQKQLIESLIFMKNFNPKNQLIITTHSPYVLTVLNNLLFAKKVVTHNETNLQEVETIIPKEFHIAASDFAAYSLGNSLIEDTAYCEKIVNEKTGLIKQNYLDTVSDMLGGDFDYLYQLYSKSVAKNKL